MFVLKAHLHFIPLLKYKIIFYKTKNNGKISSGAKFIDSCKYKNVTVLDTEQTRPFKKIESRIQCSSDVKNT